MQNNIIPIFIIGSARNGTTNLENTIAALPQVLGVEHWLHYGSCESSLYMNNRYWGDLSDADQYIKCLYQYASSDYFQLANGDIEYHLKHKRNCFYTFFLDLMDRYAKRKDCRYWITKFDPHFFMDQKERRSFLSLLYSRYKEVKFIRIQRNFKDAFKSYRNMEGQNHERRQKMINLWPALLLQSARYTLTYQGEVERMIFDISFKKYINEQKSCLQDIADYLAIGMDNWSSINFNRFQVNSSFVSKKKKELPGTITTFIPKILFFFERYPSVARMVWRTYFKMKTKVDPTFKRLIKHTHFRECLMDDLSNSKANGLLRKIQNENTTADS